MVAVGDVQRGDAGERRDERVAVGAADRARSCAARRRPRVKSMSGGAAVARAADAIDLRRRAVGEEHRAGLRAEGEHVARAVVFLVAARALVLLDDVAIVFVDREARGEAGLHVAAHPQPVEVDARLVFDDERRVCRSATKFSAARS